MNKTFILSLGLLFLVNSPCLAQQATPQTPPPPPAANNSNQPSVRQVAARLSEETGNKVLVTAALAGKLASSSDMAVTKETNVEDALTSLAKRFPDATWAKVYLPAPTDRRYTGDAVAQFARAQTGLFGRQNKTEGTTVALLGKQMSLDEAQPYIKGLGLEPYYVLMNRNDAAAAVQGQLAALNEGAAGRGSAAMAALLKKLGVSSPKDIPSGEYDVTVPDENGVSQPAHIKVENTDGKSSIMIRMGSNP